MPLSSTVAMLPDTPDSRLLVELSSYHDDLSEALAALEQALESGRDSTLWQPLTSYGVVAYMRAFAHSNVRSGLLEHIPVPDDLVETPQIFGQVMGEMFELIASGVLGPSAPTVRELSEGPRTLQDLEARATVGKLALVP